MADSGVRCSHQTAQPHCFVWCQTSRLTHSSACRALSNESFDSTVNEQFLVRHQWCQVSPPDTTVIINS